MALGRSEDAPPMNPHYVHELVQIGEYPQPDIRGPMPKNAHPDSTFSSHLHNDWTQLQLDSQIREYPSPDQRGESMAEKLAYKPAYEGEPVPADRRYFDFEEPTDYIQLNQERSYKDIAQNFIDPSVREFANNNVDQFNGGRSQEAPPMNPHYVHESSGNTIS